MAISAEGPSMESRADPRFGRCAYFVIVDTETGSYEAVPNSAAQAAGGAGIRAAEILARKGVEAVATGNVGPNAVASLEAAGITIYLGAIGTVQETLQAFREGRLALSRQANPSLGRGGGGLGRGPGSGGRGGPGGGISSGGWSGRVSGGPGRRGQ